MINVSLKNFISLWKSRCYTQAATKSYMQAVAGRLAWAAMGPLARAAAFLAPLARVLRLAVVLFCPLVGVDSVAEAAKVPLAVAISIVIGLMM
jgi:hypothetical protein